MNRQQPRQIDRDLDRLLEKVDRMLRREDWLDRHPIIKRIHSRLFKRQLTPEERDAVEWWWQERELERQYQEVLDQRQPQVGLTPEESVSFHQHVQGARGGGMDTPEYEAWCRRRDRNR